ncbi:RDD family protein [Pseudonocardia hispaniensis]|uniref:RDD family protein n=1 Tax=Pseudonocardia hispaniensis TaxID=904933 RepID=A0ABW1IWI9_9PSEU
MNNLAGRRGRAYLRDCLTYLGLAAATAPFGIIGRRTGWGGNRVFVLAVSALPPLAATILAASQESGPAQATWGKRTHGLVVTDGDGAPIGFGRATLRNAAKIGVPWQIGHVVAIGAAFGGFEKRDPLTRAATVVTYPLLAAMIVAVLRGNGRGLHDRVAGTAVRRRAAPAC